MTFSRPRDADYGMQTSWTMAYPSAASLKIGHYLSDGSGTPARNLFVQTADTVALLGPDGQAVFSQQYPVPPATSLGDVNGDGSDDIVVAVPDGGSAEKISVFSQGKPLWTGGLITC